MKKKRGRIPITKGVDYARCKGCLAKYKGVIKDKEGNVERRISCQTNCIFLKKDLITHI